MTRDSLDLLAYPDRTADPVFLVRKVCQDLQETEASLASQVLWVLREPRVMKASQVFQVSHVAQD